VRRFVVALGVLLAGVVAIDLVAVDPRHTQARRATERFLRESTPAPLVRIANFADPASVPCAEAQFFDSSHQNAECLSRIFRGLTAGMF